MRYRFNQIFRQNPNGSLSPLQPVNINGITFGPGVSIGPGVFFGGVNIFDFLNNAIEADEIKGVFIVRGFYSS